MCLIVNYVVVNRRERHNWFTKQVVRLVVVVVAPSMLVELVAQAWGLIFRPLEAKRQKISKGKEVRPLVIVVFQFFYKLNTHL